MLILSCSCNNTNGATTQYKIRNVTRERARVAKRTLTGETEVKVGVQCCQVRRRFSTFLRRWRMLLSEGGVCHVWSLDVGLYIELV